MRNGTHRFLWIALLFFGLLSSLAAAQDIGFDVISEGVVEEASEESSGQESPLSASAYGRVGTSATGAFWGAAGIRAAIGLDALEIHGDAQLGTEGIVATAGVTTTLFGLGTTAEIVYTGGQPVISLRAWGEAVGFDLSANITFATGGLSALLSATTEMDSYGLSGSLGLAGGNLTTASVGFNTQMGDMTVSASGGWAGGQFSLGGGAGLQIGPVNVTANAGYSSGLGINGVVGGGVAFDGIDASAVVMLDNTGIGIEASGEVALGAATVTGLARLGGTDLSVEVGGRISLGSLSLSISVAFDSSSGFSWAEVGFEMPLL